MKIDIKLTNLEKDIINIECNNVLKIIKYFKNHIYIKNISGSRKKIIYMYLKIYLEDIKNNDGYYKDKYPIIFRKYKINKLIT